MSIYKDCDIRGIFGEEFDESVIRPIGRAIGRRLKGRSIVVAGDVRISTPVIKEQLIAGLTDEGAHIIDIGTAPTPAAYFAKSRACFDAYALAIVTASHNPPKYNGIKLMFGDLPPTPEQIRSIQTDAEGGAKTGPSGDGSGGSYEKTDITDRYCEYIKKMMKPVKGIKVVLDIGNGTTAGIAPRIFRELGYEVTELFGEPDGNFPGRDPNPANFKNLGPVCAAVTETGADFGAAFDGDGDRVVFVDDKGRPVINEKALILMTRYEYAGPGFSVVYDQKCSRILPEAVEAMGGEPILERSGHAFIKKTFLEHDSILGGEISGHFFFREMGHDDGIYAGLCMGAFLDAAREKGEGPGSPRRLSEIADEIPTPHISPDLRYKVSYGRMDEVLGRIEEHYRSLGMPISTYDGVRVSLPRGWLLVRKSITEEAMTLKIEADSDERIEELRKEIVENYFS